MISDKHILPPDMPHSRYYGERMIYLQGSYQPQDEFKGLNITRTNHATIDIEDRATDRYDDRRRFLEDILRDREDVRAMNEKLSRHDFGYNLSAVSSDDMMWLICFNRLSKVTPDAFTDWMHIMMEYPRSILILMVKSLSAARYLKVRYSTIQINDLRLYPCNMDTHLYMERHYE